LTYLNYLKMRNNLKSVSKKFEKNLINEVKTSFKLMREVKCPLISFFGSARISENSKEHQYVQSLSESLAKKGFGIITGGGSGVMKAANQECFNTGSISIGIQAKQLISEHPQNSEKLFSHKISLKSMFLRRFIIASRSDALIFAGGGIGTLDELFENIMLMQTGIVEKIPIILTNEQMYLSLMSFLKNNLEELGYLNMRH
jgi:uncharacterized protein (TIGR00730 family)